MNTSISSSFSLSIGHAIQWGFSQLSEHSESAQLDAEVCLQHCLNKNRTYLYTWPDKNLTANQWQAFANMIAKRKLGQPIAHIIGEREFWSLPFLVNETTLIPRPDTEILVETALNLPLAEDARILDLGTGTGAIALALASEKPQWKITAVDKVADAVTLAKANQARLSLPQVEICQSDWFSAIKQSKFDLIVSNPPYIDHKDHHLTQGDVRFEPLSALTANEQGFADLFHIASHAKQHLTENGYLLMEHGYKQGLTLRQKMSELGYLDVGTIRDFGSNERCTLGRLAL
ncbi:MAG: peptide chain release factor N(5)-glutamine methyltransferase [Parashewanella sp.]